MIDYIKYTVDGKSYSLTNCGDNTWSRKTDAPGVSGNYSLLFEISENGIVTYIDSSDSCYSTFLQVIESQKNIKLIELLPDFLQDILEFKVLFDAEKKELEELILYKQKIKDDLFLTSASNDALTRIEKFLSLKGQGTLDQRRSFLISLFQKGNKLDEKKIKDITKTITGSGCIVTYYDSKASDNPQPGCGLLKIQVLSPDENKNYRYDDIARALEPLIPGHIKMQVIKYFSTWDDLSKNFADWNAIHNTVNWQAIKDYIPPQQGGRYGS